MQANAISLLSIFETKLRLEVPLFQRQYVWTQEQQWEPLWEDISRKFSEYLDGRKDAPVHFLGAMVLDQKLTPVTHVARRQVIDGQQRLTTLQIFLAALRDFCLEQNCQDIADECEAYLLNKGMMGEPDVEKFKVWPTQLDRRQFRDVIEARSLVELEKKHPIKRQKYAKRPDARPPMVEAYLYFASELREFFIGSDAEPPQAHQVALHGRLVECFQALKNALKIVAIDLDKEDDAQIIFETLNARGAALLPADLLRNSIFLRAARTNESQEKLYETYWAKFDEPFWREEVKQGRLTRPRSDLFMQHFLASRQGRDIPIKHLYVEYKAWIERDKPFANIKEELAALSRQGDDFRRIIAPKPEDPIFHLVSFLDTYDIRTAYPLLLMLLDVGISDSEWKAISRTLESYLLRRAICGFPTKNYNRVFLQLTKSLRASPNNQSLVDHLGGLTGESAAWPSDPEFSARWRTMDAYNGLGSPRTKLVHVLKRLNATYLGNKMEDVIVANDLTVEHLMPQSWVEGWPLPDGSKGLNAEELILADENAPAAVASRSRNAACQSFGNLTIITQALNSSVSNGPWTVKRPELLKHSLLPINQMLHDRTVWDESAIVERGQALLDRALSVWPRS